MTESKRIRQGKTDLEQVMKDLAKGMGWIPEGIGNEHGIKIEANVDVKSITPARKRKIGFLSQRSKI